jgi:hypothetical protein
MRLRIGSDDQLTLTQHTFQVREGATVGDLRVARREHDVPARQRGRATPRACAPAPATRSRHRLSGGHPLGAQLASGDQRPRAPQRPGPSPALERLAWSGRRWRDLNPREGCALNPLSRSSDERPARCVAWSATLNTSLRDGLRTVQDGDE